LGIRHRAANDLEHLGGRRLMRQRLVALAGEPRDLRFLVSSRGATTAQAFGALCRFSVAFFRRRALAGSSSDFERRIITFSKGQADASYRLRPTLWKGLRPALCNCSLSDAQCRIRVNCGKSQIEQISSALHQKAAAMRARPPRPASAFPARV